MRRLTVSCAVIALLSIAVPALACGGLVNPNGTVALVKTTTLAGYRYGVEHYITSFRFQGGGAEFGSIVPLPGIPSRVRRAGDWTLQRLVREITPPRPTPTPGSTLTTATTTSSAEVIYETEIDSVKITILKGGGRAVGRWAKENGFALTPDAPEVLDHYAALSPIFMAARFDPEDAKGSAKNIGDGVPIHLTIRTDKPWVPLRILGLGQANPSIVTADLFLLTKREPVLTAPTVPAGTTRGLVLERSGPASLSLLSDLRADKGMNWVHESKMWLNYLRINETAEVLKYDLEAFVPPAAAVTVGAELASERS